MPGSPEILILMSDPQDRVSKDGRVTGAYVYILQCADGGYYTGLTHRGPDERESEHNQGIDPTAWTFSRRPVKLVWCEHFERFDEAIATERRIKGWSRVKKEALIRRDYDVLPSLAARGRRKDA